MSVGRPGSARRIDRRDATGGAEAGGPERTGRRPVACVPGRRRPGVAERHGERRPGAFRHRPAAGRLSGLRRRGQAGRHVLHPLESAGRPGGSDRHEREHGVATAHRAGGGRRFRPPPAATGPGGNRRLRQPGRHPAAVYEHRPRARAGDSADVGRRVDVDVQRDLHRAEGPQENRRQERRRNPATVDHRPVGRRGHVEPAAVRRSPGSREALRNRDLRDRAGFDRRVVVERPGLQGSRVRAPAAVAGDRRPGLLPLADWPISQTSTARSRTSCRASTPWAIPPATHASTARGEGSWCASTAPTSPREPNRAISLRRANELRPARALHRRDRRLTSGISHAAMRWSGGQPRRCWWRPSSRIRSSSA